MSPFEKIYADHYPRMFRIAKKMIGNSDHASDIVQDVFIYLFEVMQNGKQIHYPNSWLYKAIANKCIDHLRTRMKFQPIESIAGKEEGDELPDQDAVHRIQRALAALKPNEKALLVLYGEGLSYQEISETMGMKFSSVGKTLSRTLEKLENELKKQNNDLS